MIEQPHLETQRLILRPFRPDDARDVQRLAGAYEIAATTAAMPHPYEDGMAESWIATHANALANDEAITYAVTLKEGERAGGPLAGDPLVGAIGLSLATAHRRAEIGYWIGVPYWGQGYCTEAAAEVLRFAFEDLDLHRVMARHFRINPASGRVMQKIGLQYEGRMREHFCKWGQFQDIELYGLLQHDWLATRQAGEESRR